MGIEDTVRMSVMTLSGRANLETHNIFFNPPNLGGGIDDYSYNDVYKRSSIIQLAWATNYTDYEIQLWRQWIGGGGADQGPTVYASNRPPASQYEIQKFEWTVQPYRFDVSKSPVFFFWARAGDTGLFSSHYFNITNEASLTSSAASSKAMSTSNLPVRTTSPLHPSLLPSSSTVAISSMVANPGGPSAPLISPTTSSTNPSATVESSRGADDGLSVIGKVGIGLGSGVSLLIIVLCLIFGYRFAKRRARAPQNKRLPPYPPPSYARSQGLAISHPSSDWGKTPSPSTRYMCELGSPEPKELSARRTIFELPTFQTPRPR